MTALLAHPATPRLSTLHSTLHHVQSYPRPGHAPLGHDDDAPDSQDDDASEPPALCAPDTAAAQSCARTPATLPHTLVERMLMVSIEAGAGR